MTKKKTMQDLLVLAILTPRFQFCLGVIALVLSLGAGELPAQTEYAVYIREAGGRKTYFGEGQARNATHTSRLFGIARIEFSGAFERPFTFLGILHAKKQGRANVFAPFSDRDPVYAGVSYLADIGRGSRMESLVLSVDEPNKKVWLFPQGRASAVQLVANGASRMMALRMVAPFAFWVEPAEQTFVNQLAGVVILDPALSRRLNARSPTNLGDAGDKLITLLSEDGWQNRGFDAF